ncbi:reverse transcriptase [Purpureocillium lavendulum]|uniref:Reverse transcriptase n=1 Tax=Purpureocillium lavendulum TaxID=1247861 RepID=A0AB34FAT0_9HYPO|nr:reverse transcriptase [Purpureocillium lavendulum]
MRKHRNLFHRRKAATQDAKRKAVEDRVTISSWFDGWSKYHSQSNIRKENIWNFDETGFMVGYLQRGGFVWTFTDVDRPILCDSHDRVSVTTIETISAAGETIPPFIILPGVNIPGKWLANDLEGGAMLATSEKGYISDRIALEWLQHFEKKTRPLDAEEKRLLLMDNCEAHYTSEFVSFCIDHNIDLFPLPPHLTHLLQPLDVGVFGPYKHWHQHILHREVADGAYDFGKSDFLYHLQEMRNRTFKKTTILSAWEKTGLYPYNPLRVLDSLQDSLSSLTPKVNESSLPGFVETHKDTGPARSPHAFAERPATPPNQSANLSPTTPPTIRRFDWLSVCTPSLSVPQIQRYHEYVGLRMHVSIYSNVALTPSVAHVYDKACKASKALELNGVAATAELRRLQKKSLERQRRDEHTMVVAKFGPISMHDARLRAARDEYNRQAAQEDEQRRIFRRDVRQEVGCFRRWLRETRARVRKSVSRLRTRDLFLRVHSFEIDDVNYGMKEGSQTERWFNKADRRLHLNSDSWMAYRYAIHRELLDGRIRVDQPHHLQWPEEVDGEVLEGAVQQVIGDAANQSVRREVLMAELDGNSVMADSMMEEAINSEEDSDDESPMTATSHFGDTDTIVVGGW